MLICRAAIGSAQQAADAAAAQVEQLSKAVRDVRGRVEQRRADSQAQTSQGAVVKALMAAKSSKEIPGILGRLGDAQAVMVMQLGLIGLACLVAVQLQSKP